MGKRAAEQRDGVVRVRRAGLLRRRCERGRWRLEPAEGVGFQEAVDELRRRRKVAGINTARVRLSGAVVLHIPSRNQNAAFRGRLRQQADGGLEFSGAMRETLSAVLVPMLYGWVTLMMAAVLALGVLAVVWPPLVIGVVGTPIMGTFTVYFHRGRGGSYATDSHRLYRDLAALLAPLNPHPLDAGTPELDVQARPELPR